MANKNSDGLTYDEAVEDYCEWVCRYPGSSEMPLRDNCEERDGIWHLVNSAGSPLARVGKRGRVKSEWRGKFATCESREEVEQILRATYCGALSDLDDEELSIEARRLLGGTVVFPST